MEAKKVKVMFTFPQIVFETKEVEVSEEKAESLIEDHNGRAAFIMENLTEREKEWIPATSNGLEDWFHNGLVRIQRISEPEITITASKESKTHVYVPTVGPQERMEIQNLSPNDTLVITGDPNTVLLEISEHERLLAVERKYKSLVDHL